MRNELAVTDSTQTASADKSGDSSINNQVFTSMIVDKDRATLIKDGEQHITDPAKLKEFKHDVQAFDARAAKQNLSPEEIRNTYAQIDRLFSGNGSNPLTEAQRVQLAEETMRSAAAPTEISQGHYNTCNVTAVEARIFTRDPSKAAGLIADVALNGSYKASNGTVVDFNGSLSDSRQPHGDSANTDIDADYTNGTRSYASQIFQVTAVNLHYRNLAKSDPNGYYQYEQHDNDYKPPHTGFKSANGEVLAAYTKNGKFLQTVDLEPSFYIDDMMEVMNQISGKDEKGVILIQKAENQESKTAAVTGTPEALDAKLAKMKEDNQLPAIIEIGGSDVLFSRQYGDGPHVVSVTDYDSKAKTVAVDNEWTKNDDYLGDHSLRMTDVYKAMINPADTSADKQARAQRDLRERNADRAKGVTDIGIEWAYTRDAMIASGNGFSEVTLGKNTEDALNRTGPILKQQMADGTLDDRQGRIAARDMAADIAIMDQARIEEMTKQPYWPTACALMKRYPDVIATSNLDDSRKAIIMQQ